MTPKLRQTIYQLGTVISGLVSILLLWHGISNDTADSLLQILTGIGGLFGTGASGTAAVVVGKQAKNGTFDDVSPVDAVINGVQAVTEAAATAASDLEKIKQALPDIGPLAEQVIAKTLNK